MLITSIPQELIEHILVIAATDGYPGTVSALSQTCKHFYHFLSLRSDNRHLWRDLFLAVFDDPYQNELEGTFDWKKEFLNRMQVQRSFKRWTTMMVDGTKNKEDENKNGQVQECQVIKDTKAAHEEEKQLLDALRTLVKALTIENPPMAPDLSSSSSSSSSTSSTSSSDSDDFDNMMLFGAPLSATHLAYPLLIVLHALASQRRARGVPSVSLHSEETWGMQLLDTVKSATSAWAEGILKNGYPSALKERLLTFDAWIYRRPKQRRRPLPSEFVSSIPPSLLSPLTNADIVSDPDWEYTETGRLFYKLVLMKGYVFDRSDGSPRSTARSSGIPRKTLSEQKKVARVVARRRVYDMRYLTRDRLFGPYLPLGKSLEFGLPVPGPEKSLDETGTSTSNSTSASPGKAKGSNNTMNGGDTTDDGPSSSHPPRSANPSASTSEDEGEIDGFQTDMLHLITAGIHPHYLIHHHLFHHPLSDDEDTDVNNATTNGGANGFAGGSDGYNTTTSQGSENENVNETSRIENAQQASLIDPFSLAETSPHKVVPDYAFLSAARLLVEMNMKDAWGSLIGIGQGADGDGDDDSDDEDYDEGSDDYDEDDEAEEESEENVGDHRDENEVVAANINETPIQDQDSPSSSSPSASSSSPSGESTVSTSGSSLASSSHSSNFQLSEWPVTVTNGINVNNNEDEESGQVRVHDGDQGEAGDVNGEGTSAFSTANFSRDTRRWVERLVDAFSALDFVRMGGAVGYWRNVRLDVRDWRRRSRRSNVEEGEGRKGKGKEEEKVVRNRKGKGKGKAKDDEEECEGWDWAGVEGEWRRVVCWMDYQDLLLHSSGVTHANPSSEIDEAIRLFPLKLHITGYSPPPAFPASSSSSSSPPPSPISSLPIDATSIDGSGDETTNPDALIWHLPVIHFAGESRLPESTHFNGNGNGQLGELVRRIRGSVRMIGDGAVRWTMTSSHVNQTDPEWAMEGVQVGCIGSAVGVVGMWTGTDHIRGDPIGPCWQWKVT